MSAKKELYRRLYELAYFGEAEGSQVQYIYLELGSRLKREAREQIPAQKVKEVLLTGVKP